MGIIPGNMEVLVCITPPTGISQVVIRICAAMQKGIYMLNIEYIS